MGLGVKVVVCLFFTFYKSERSFRSHHMIWIGSGHKYQETRTRPPFASYCENKPEGATTQSWIILELALKNSGEKGSVEWAGLQVVHVAEHIFWEEGWPEHGCP